MKSLTNVNATCHFDPENNPMKTPKKLISVEVKYQRDTFDIERLVEATRILMEALEDDFDTEGDVSGS